MVGARLKQRIEALSLRNDIAPISAPRGPGAMVAFDVLKADGSGEPDGALAKAVTAAAIDKGLILLSCGVHGETIRILAPLTASDEIIDEGLDILQASLREVAGR